MNAYPTPRMKTAYTRLETDDEYRERLVVHFKDPKQQKRVGPKTCELYIATIGALSGKSLDRYGEDVDIARRIVEVYP